MTFDLIKELGDHKPNTERGMSTSFSKRLGERHLAVIDLTPYVNGYVINRINVPRQYRGAGVARDLLGHCLAEADVFDEALWLIVSASDGLSASQLTDWYRRHLFVPVDGNPGLMLRVRRSLRELVNWRKEGKKAKVPTKLTVSGALLDELECWCEFRGVGRAEAAERALSKLFADDPEWVVRKTHQN